MLNDEGVLTPEGLSFSPPHVFGIYKKGKIRLERINRKDIVIVTEPIVEVFKSIESLFETYNRT